MYEYRYKTWKDAGARYAFVVQRRRVMETNPNYWKDHASDTGYATEGIAKDAARQAIQSDKAEFEAKVAKDRAPWKGVNDE